MMQPSIVYEDEDILVINKPSGLLTHPKNTNDTSDSVVQWAIGYCPQIKDVIDSYGADDDDLEASQYASIRPGVVHRLDKETSGLLLLTKTKEAFKYCKKLFQERAIKKTYVALVHGIVRRVEGRIDQPLAMFQGKQTTRLHGTHELEGKAAITDYIVRHRYSEDYSLLEVSPQTGRTHQIRVHLKHIGHPIVCDPLYSPKSKPCPVNLGRLFLHAQKLAFISPSGQKLVLETELPPELSAFLASLSPLD